MIGWTEWLAVVALALLCGAWVLVQQWIARRDPEAPSVERHCGCGHGVEPARHDPSSRVGLR